MKKLLFVAFISICTMQSFGQYYYQVAFQYMWSPGPTSIESINVGITTAQTTSPGVVSTNTVTGTFMGPAGLFTYGVAPYTPSFFMPMSITINAGYSAMVRNTTGAPAKVRMAVAMYQPNGIATYVYGPYVTIAPISDATLPIPACSTTYSAPLPASSSYPGTTYPVPVTILLSQN